MDRAFRKPGRTFIQRIGRPIQLALLLLVMCLAPASQAQQQPDLLFGQTRLSDNPRAHTLFLEWYTKFLAGMDESTLVNPFEKRAVYRLMWLRSFDNPIIVRLVINPFKSPELIVKRADGKGGYEPGTLITSKSLRVTPKDIARFLEEFQKADFFALPPFDESHHGLDGARWILEANVRGSYHLVHRWTDGLVIHDASMQLLILSGENLEPIY